MENFTPVTEQIQLCVSESLRNTDAKSLKVNNVFTFVYFLWVLGIQHIKNIYLGYFHDSLKVDEDV